MDRNEALKNIEKGEMWFLSNNEELSNDYEFMLQAVSITNYAMQYAGDELKNNEDFMVDAFSKNAGILRFAGKIKNSEQFKNRISEINNKKIEEVKNIIGTEKFDIIQKERATYSSPEQLVPAPLVDGEVEYSYYDDVPEWHYMSGKRKEFCCLEHVTREKYKDGQLTEARLFDYSLTNDSKSLFFTPEGELEREVIYDSYYSESDYTENFYREDGTKKSSYSHQDNEYDYSDSAIVYADDGKTILREVSYKRDSNGYEQYHLGLNDKNGKRIYYADYRDEEYYGQGDTEYTTRIERAYYDLLSHKKISKEEFLRQLNEKYKDGNDIIPELGISKNDLTEFLSKDFGITRYIEDGIVMDNDMDNYYVVDLYHNQDRSTVKWCDDRDGKNFSVSKYNSNNQLITQSVTKDGKTTEVVDKSSSQEVSEQLAYKLGDLHGFEEIVESANARKIGDISKVMSEFSEATQDKTQNNVPSLND